MFILISKINKISPLKSPSSLMFIIHFYRIYFFIISQLQLIQKKTWWLANWIYKLLVGCFSSSSITFNSSELNSLASACFEEKKYFVCCLFSLSLTHQVFSTLHVECSEEERFAMGILWYSHNVFCAIMPEISDYHMSSARSGWRRIFQQRGEKYFNWLSIK